MVSNDILWPFASLKGPKKTDAFKARRAKEMPRGPHSQIDFMGPTYLKKWKQPDVPYEKFRKLFNFASEKLRGAAEDRALAHGAEPSQGGGPSKTGGATVSSESVPDSKTKAPKESVPSASNSPPAPPDPTAKGAPTKPPKSTESAKAKSKSKADTAPPPGPKVPKTAKALKAKTSAKADTAPPQDAPKALLFAGVGLIKPSPRPPQKGKEPNAKRPKSKGKEKAVPESSEEEDEGEEQPKAPTPKPRPKKKIAKVDSSEAKTPPKRPTKEAHSASDDEGSERRTTAEVRKCQSPHNVPTGRSCHTIKTVS
ncbi:hypothetical protein HYPSUDRAFT_210312 [Hypholoma sublateritium FD-334 SS-4]|uniref:Uncharacterized protein n=1 Tax=Hypholoma sublateritium (strain FD-334 SS-4) TaxID=945553 RepID=A0A0D2N096_HYPSF|nr:hypothetical protein HYPSUDRAFT_210312 [Hypholoma sublateritium FD-334 SS-4]